jgi:predicted HicB family RNase H-like nuclease
MAGRKWSKTLNNIMTIDGVKAVIQYDPEIEMFRGEFIGLNGGADFYAKDVEGLKREAETSLRVFLAMCREDGVEPYLKNSGKFLVRLPSELHQRAVLAAKATGVSLNAFVERAIHHELGHSQ